MAGKSATAKITTQDVSRALDENFDAKANGTRPSLTSQDRDALSLLVSVLKGAGWRNADIAGACCMTPGAVSRVAARSVVATPKMRSELQTWALARLRPPRAQRALSGVMITSDSVTRSYGSTVALDDVSFEVGSGITGLLGPNGAGKTTFIKLALGVLRPDFGEITVLGGDPSDPRLRARIGWTSEDDTFWPDAKGIDIVSHFGEMHGLPATESLTRAGEVLNLLSMGEERSRPFKTLSTGQKQRVKLGSAIVHDPDLVLLDEPTNGLDPVQREAMLSMIKRIGHEIGISVLLSSHLLDEVERTVDSVVIIDAGTVRAQGEMDVLSGTTDELRIEVAGDNEKFAKAVRKAGGKARVDASVVLVELKSDLIYDKVRNAAVESGVGIRKLSKTKKSLEDVFLKS